MYKHYVNDLYTKSELERAYYNCLFTYICMYMILCRYRKVAGDVCMGGEASLFNAFEAPCCENSTLPPTPHIPTLPPSSSSAPNPTTTPDIPTVPPSSSSSTPNPTTNPPGGAQKGSNDGTLRMVLIVLGVFLTLACFAAVALLFLFIGLTLWVHMPPSLPPSLPPFLPLMEYTVTLYTMYIHCSKYKGLRKKYIRVMTAGEPDLHRYTASSGRENSPDAHTPGNV